MCELYVIKRTLTCVLRGVWDDVEGLIEKLTGKRQHCGGLSIRHHLIQDLSDSTDGGVL